MAIFSGILKNIETDPKLLGKVTTCDESWFFYYDHQTIPNDVVPIHHNKGKLD